MRSIIFTLIISVSAIAWSIPAYAEDPCSTGAYHYKQYVSFLPNPKELSETVPELVTISYGTLIVTPDGLYIGTASDALTNPAPAFPPTRQIPFTGLSKKISEGKYEIFDVGFIAFIDLSFSFSYLPIDPDLTLAFVDRATVTALDDDCKTFFADGTASLYPPDTVDYDTATPSFVFYLQADLFKHAGIDDDDEDEDD